MAQFRGTFSMCRKQWYIQLIVIIIALILLASVGIYKSNNNNNYNNITDKVSTKGTTNTDSLVTVTSAYSNFNKISEYKMYEATGSTRTAEHNIRNVDEKIHYNLNNKLQLRDEGDAKPNPVKTIRTFNDGDKYKFVRKHHDDHHDDNNDDSFNNDKYATNNIVKFLKLTYYNDAMTKSNQGIATETKKINLNNSSTIVKTNSRVEASLSALIERAEVPKESHSSTDTIKDLVLLHRRKRYLLFPESSSFQMIFDLIIGVVDYTKFAILGITCAVAWELPSKPPSEIIEDVRQKLFNGTLGLQRRNDTFTETDFHTMDNPFPELAYNDNNNNRYYSADNMKTLPKKDYYYSNPAKPAQSFNDNYKPQESNNNINNNYNNNNQQYGPSAYGNSYNKIPVTPANMGYGYTNSRVESNDYNRWSGSGENNWWNRNQDRVQKQWQQQQQKWQKYNTFSPPRTTTYEYRQASPKIPVYDSARNAPQYYSNNYGRRGRARKILTETPKHRIYSIYGKRRRRRREVYDNDEKIDEIHLREHLRSRHKLYRKIEKVFKTAGQNGTACVLRALCETAHKNRSHNYRKRRSEPDDFIQEILRAIFTLPQKEVIGESDIGKHYVEAHAMSEVCNVQPYNDCSHSIWSDKVL